MVIAGNDKGKTGTVMGIKKDRVIVKGVNVRKKYVKNPNQKKSSQVVYLEIPINISNVALCDMDGKKIKKLKIKETEKEKQLVYMRDEKEVVHRKLKTKR